MEKLLPDSHCCECENCTLKWLTSNDMIMMLPPKGYVLGYPPGVPSGYSHRWHHWKNICTFHRFLELTNRN